MAVVQKSCIGLVALFLLFSSLALAQRDMGTLTGTVTDPSGAVVPGATVTISEASTGQNYKLQTSSSGDFTRPALPPGTYTVTAEAKGFRRVSQEKVVLTAGGRTGVQLALAVGEISETVQVTGEAPLLQNESTQLGASLNASTVSSMPLGGQRLFTYLARLSPGVVPTESGRDGGTGGFSANGVRGTGQNNFLLNGVDNNVNVIDFLNGASFVIAPPPEAISEMQVMTSGYNAEYGRGAGGVVNVNLKGGTNELHGAVWEILQNEKLNANAWANNRVGAKRPSAKQNQFGGALGGPILKNKLFIFGDYQGTRVANTGSSGYMTLPTMAERTGDFSGLLGGSIGTSALGTAILQNQIFDPKSTRTVNGVVVRDPFTGNKISASQQDLAAQKIINAVLPQPNQVVPPGFPQNNFYYNNPQHQQQDAGDLRSDFRMSEKDSLYGSVSWQDANNGGAPLFPDGGGGSGGANLQTTLTRNGQLGYTRVWSPSIVTESRAGYTRLVTSITGPYQTADLYKAYGIGGYDPTNAMPQNGGLPGLSPSRYQGFGAGGWEPMLMYSNVKDFVQNVAVMKGSHAFKFGGEYRFIQFPFAQFSDPHGDMNFTQNATAYPATGNLSANTGDSVASFLLGVVDNGTISSTNLISSQKESFAFYGQDDWKISRKLSVNLGMRYELFSPTYERFGRESNFTQSDLTLNIPKGRNQDQALPPNFASTFPNVKVSRGQLDKYMFKWDKWDFGPRIGLAYNIVPKTVIRLGFGIFYGGEENLGGDPNLGQAAPFNYTMNLGRTDRNLNPIGNFDANPWFPGGLSGGWDANVFSLPAPVNMRGLDTSWRSPMVQKWNAAVQQTLPWGMALEVAYVGNHQAHEIQVSDGNGGPNLGSADPAVTREAMRPVPYIGSTKYTSSNYWGNYDALTAKLEKRLSGGVEFIAAYTWAHTMSNSYGPLQGGNIIDYTNLNLDYANAQWDTRHNFTAGFTYEVPVGKGRAHGANLNPVLNHIVGGWGLNGILSLRTGRPNTITDNMADCQGAWVTCRVDVVPGRDPNNAPSGGRSWAKWFDTSAVRAAAPLTGGNLGLLTLIGPGTSTLDTSLFKNFRFNERFNLEFRMEAFNLFNKVQLGNPDVNFQDSTFGQITGASGERKAQISLRLRF